MYAWGFESCRACLVSGDVATMYNLALPEIMELYNECSETNITVLAAPLENIPLHICDMCYRLCGMMRSFKRRCQETEKKLSERSPQMPVQPEWVDEAVAEQVGVKEEPMEPYEQAQEDHFEDPLTNDESYTDPEEIQDFDDPSTHADTSHRPRQDETPEIVNRRSLWPPVNLDKYGHLVWAPGPNTNGVWKYFLRDMTRDYRKCLWEGCGKVIACKGSSTMSMRRHMSKHHSVNVPKKAKFNDLPPRARVRALEHK